MDKTIAEKLLAQTRENYDSFAESFSQTREYVWPEVKVLIGGCVEKGDRALDIGCGNGRMFPLFKDIGADYVGVDNSINLIKIAKNKFPGTEFVVGDCLDLPFENGSFDSGVSLAVIHHIPSKKYQKQFLKEAGRVLKPGGRLMITAWDLRFFTMAKEKKWKRLRIFLKTQIKIALGLEKLDLGDFFIPWQNQYRRYHHVFGLGELKNLAKSAGFAVERSGVFKNGQKEANLYIIAKKLQN